MIYIVSMTMWHRQFKYSESPSIEDNRGIGGGGTA